VTRVLGLVPDREGSNGVPGKNLKPLAGASLVEYAARPPAAGREVRHVQNTPRPR
jgi:CMP-N-acetylneuraminic acid synthetase